MPRRTQTKKTAKPASPSRFRRRNLRFDLSLVILIGMLSFSLLLLLLSLNKSSAIGAKMKAQSAQLATNNPAPKRPVCQALNDGSLDFKLTMPVQLGEWLYKVGEVKSLTDDSLSDQYLKIFVPLPGAQSNDFDQQNKNILTIRKFSKSEWRATGKDCPDGEICVAAGEMITKTTGASGDTWIYAYTKPADCPKSIEAKCALADKIIESFQLK